MLRPLLTRALFAGTVFFAAALVFLVQPMIVKQLLPVFGGAPSVWNTAVVFFQVVLLAGYGMAHLSFRALGARRQPLVPLIAGIVALGFVPFAVRASAAAPSSVPPAVWVATLLLLSVGVPYLAVAMASPILQRWYASTGERGHDDPYFLYTASNAGSLLGLLAFPFVLEPTLSTTGQERAWAILFVTYLLGLVGCALVVRGRAGAVVEEAQTNHTAVVPAGDTSVTERAASSRQRRLGWVVLAAIPSSLMLGVTTYITTDVASAPLIWVVPLALYLISFMLTFGRRVRVGSDIAGIVVAAATVALIVVELDVWIVGDRTRVVVHLIAMLCAATLAHARLYESRPPARELTGFYLRMSIGGALGGAFTALAAPVLFERIYEYPLLLAAVVLLRPAIWRTRPRDAGSALARAGAGTLELAIAAMLVVLLAASALQRGIAPFALDGRAALALAVVGFGLLAVRRWGFAFAVTCVLVLLVFGRADDSIHAERNFFGTLRVEQIGHTHRLLHGTTLHGTQFTDDRRYTPASYYSQDGPLGDAFEAFQQSRPFAKVGVVGLGTGTVVAYARLWQEFTFYEIDPAVIDVAQNSRYFTWIEHARRSNQVRIVEGDARLRLRGEPDGTYDLLVLDAYSSDSVPVHLLTTEAFAMYVRKLAPGGRMLVHVSSRHLDLEPVVAADARALGLASLGRTDPADTPDQMRIDAAKSKWLALAPDAATLDPLRAVDGWRPLIAPRHDDAWTDDFSDIAGAIDWM